MQSPEPGCNNRRKFMQVEFQPGDYQEIACDLLAYPVFEEEAADFSSLKPLDESTRGAVQDVLATREFKPELHQTCRIGRSAGLKTRNLLLIGAGKKSKFDPSRLREIAGIAVRTAKYCAAQTVAFLCRGIDT